MESLLSSFAKSSIAKIHSTKIQMRLFLQILANMIGKLETFYVVFKIRNFLNLRISLPYTWNKRGTLKHFADHEKMIKLVLIALLKELSGQYIDCLEST